MVRILGGIRLLCGLMIVAAADSLEDRLAKSAKRNNGLVVLNDDTFEQITTEERNYTAVVVLTAVHPQFQCSACREFDPEYRAIARTWVQDHPENDGVYFASLDFIDGRKTFQRLQLKSAPNIWVYPPKTHGNDPSKHVVYEISQGVQTDAVIRFLSSQLHETVHIRRPLDKMKIATTVICIVVSAIIGKFVYPSVKKYIQNKHVWAALTIFFILVFTSGYMFCQIRKTPYVANNGQGGVSYIAGGFQNQYGVETQIVSMLYALLALATLALNISVPRIKDRYKQILAVWLWSTIIYVTFGVLLHLFRSKHAGYPFKLWPS